MLSVFSRRPAQIRLSYRTRNWVGRRSKSPLGCKHLGAAVRPQALFGTQKVCDLAKYLRANYCDSIKSHVPDEQVGSSAESRPEPPATVSVLSRGTNAPSNAASIARLLRENDTQHLIDHLDELTDDEVGSLLGEFLVE